MAFINEYIPDEDKERYDFWELTIQYRNVHRADDVEFFLHNYHWTIDRERGIWLSHFRDNNFHGRGRIKDRGKEHVFVLHYNATNFEVTVWKEDDSRTHIRKTPFILVWRLLSITPSALDTDSEAELKAVLKEALAAYGDCGIRAMGSAKNPIVRFSNF